MKNIFPDKCVVLDLETTGNQAHRGDQIIQIGLCILEHGEIVEQYSTLVKPTKQIPVFIENLTGITNEAVANAPRISEVIPEIIPKLDNAALIGHNIHFDLGFLQYILEDLGYPAFSGFIFDTVELARILLPMQNGYKLEQLSEDFNIKHTAHRADSDAFATARLFIMFIQKLKELPLITIQRLIPLAHSLFSDIEVLLRRVKREKLATSESSKEENDWLIFRELALRKQGVLEAGNTRDWTPSSFADLPSLEQTLAHSFSDFEKRQGQQKYSQLILEAFSQEKHGLFEVGAGLGKTLAYLLSALYWAKQKEEKVVISTYTIVLQEQIIINEVPKLRAALPFPFSVQVLKGRNNYLCLRKFESALFNNTENNYDFILTKMKLLVWLTLTENGDVEEISLPTGGKEFWQIVQSESSSCIGERCPWYKHCFYFRAKHKAEKADLVVTNHALLLANAQREHRLLPNHQYLIIDEAHHLEYVATEQYGQFTQYRSIQFLINRLTLAEKNSLGEQIVNFLPLVTIEEKLATKVTEVAALAEELRNEIAQLFTSIVNYAEDQRAGFVEGNIRQISVGHINEADVEWQLILLHVEQNVQLMQKIKNVQTLFLSELEQKAVLSAGERSILTDWNGMIDRLARELGTLQAYFFPDEINKQIRWIEYEQRGAKNSASLVMRPLEVGPKLTRSLMEQKKSVIFTSATLQVNQSFDYMAIELGLPLESFITCQINSPFNYQEQAVLLIPNYIGMIGQVNEETLLKELAEELIELAILTNGKMLVLFTSYQALRYTYREIKDGLTSKGIYCFAQGIDSGSRGRLTKNFQSKEKAVLLGTSSFWEGVDIPGEDLSCLIMVKLPFAPPYTPYNEAKLNYLKAQGRNPFRDYSLPQAIIRFKQGFGRLIRRQSDKGVIIVYDRRIVEAGYGKLFLDSLPQLDIEHVNKTELHQKVKQWLK